MRICIRSKGGHVALLSEVPCIKNALPPGYSIQIHPVVVTTLWWRRLSSKLEIGYKVVVQSARHTMRAILCQAACERGRLNALQSSMVIFGRVSEMISSSRP